MQRLCRRFFFYLLHTHIDIVHTSVSDVMMWEPSSLSTSNSTVPVFNYFRDPAASINLDWLKPILWCLELMIYFKVASILRAAGQDCIRLVVARPVDPADPNQPVSATILVSSLKIINVGVWEICCYFAKAPKCPFDRRWNIAEGYKLFACGKEKRKAVFMLHDSFSEKKNEMGETLIYLYI